MAGIKTNNEVVSFDPFTDDVDGHFSSVLEEFFDEMWKDKHGVKYHEYKQAAKDGMDGRVPLKNLKEIKESFVDGVNRQFEKRGISTLENFAGKSNDMDFTLGWGLIKKSIEEEFEIPKKPSDGLKDIPPEPSPEDSEFEPNLDIIDYIIPFRRRQKEKKSKRVFKNKHKEWKKKMREYERYNEREISKWEHNKELEKQNKNKILDRIDNKKEKYEGGVRHIVEDIVKAKIRKTPYPHFLAFDEIKSIFEGSYTVRYFNNSKKLVVKYNLPGFEGVPGRSKIKYVRSRDEFEDVNISERRREGIYREMVFGVAVRISRQILKFDFSSGHVIDTVVFNGYRPPVDGADGSDEESCKVSVQCSRDDLQGLNLSEVNSQDAFDHLGGVKAPSLFDSSSIEPLITLDREPSEAESAVPRGHFEGEINLAELGWRAFAQLIADLFDQEFADEGGEVEVKQDSQEEGIDAIAYDPDPLRGGKFVLHAKRSAQTVGVSVVRTLHNRLLSEEADKGVLVTTSDFSRSAHDFAKDKLLQLLNGDDLLRLFERHDYEAVINWDAVRPEHGESRQ